MHLLFIQAQKDVPFYVTLLPVQDPAQSLKTQYQVRNVLVEAIYTVIFCEMPYPNLMV